MEVLYKSAGIVLFSACTALLILKTNPELSLALSAAVTALVLALTASLLQPLQELREFSRSLFGAGDVYLLPVIKCCAAALTARLTADLCREASQNAAASAVELIGVLCSLGAALPLIRTMLASIGEML